MSDTTRLHGVDRAACATLWIGSSLGTIERACLRSIMRHGHPLALYCYDEPSGVPEGVEVRDASEVLPASRIVRHAGGSTALFSNHFRYELQRRGLGTWLDADVYLLAPLLFDRPYLFGWQDQDTINSAILRLPRDSSLLPPLLRIFDEDSVPHWLGRRARLAARLRLWTTGRTGIERMPWGTAGPNALTALARQQGLDRWALPAETFYPLHYRQASLLLEPSPLVESLLTPRTVALHLWNERIKTLKDTPAPRGSFLARLQAEGS